MIWLLILVSAAAAAQPGNDVPVLHVFTYDLAGMPKGALAAAHAEAGCILGAAGLEIRWNNCSQAGAEAKPSACRDRLARSHLVVRILPQRRREYHRLPSGAAELHEILGHALCVKATEGSYINIYGKSVLRAAGLSEKRMALLLGYTIAHEMRDVLAARPDQLLFSVSDSRTLVERA